MHSAHVPKWKRKDMILENAIQGDHGRIREYNERIEQTHRHLAFVVQ